MKTTERVESGELAHELTVGDCGCSRFTKWAIIAAGSAAVGLAIAFALFGVPVNVVNTVHAVVDGNTPNPDPNPPAPPAFPELAGQIAAEARLVRSPNAAGEARALADSIDRFVRDGGDRYPTLDALFQALRGATTSAIPPASSEAWRPFNRRFDELFSALFDGGRLNTCLDACSALSEVVKGLRGGN